VSAACGERGDAISLWRRPPAMMVTPGRGRSCRR